MDLGTVEERKERILALLNDDGVSTIVLVGDTGMGKTWMVREIIKFTSSKGLCYATLWVSVTEKYDINLVYQDIAHQLSLCSVTEEWEDEEEIAEPEEENVEILKQNIRAELEKKAALSEGKKLILVLDYHEGNVKNENELCELRAVLPTSNRNPLKTLITRRKSVEAPISQETSEVKFDPLSLEGSLTLLHRIVEEKVSKIEGFAQLSEAIAVKSMGLPAAIAMIAEALNYIARYGPGAWRLESALENAAYYEKPAEAVNPLVCCAYDMLPTYVMKNCFWHSMQLFDKCGGVHYNELIAHWILEGYFDPFDHIEEAYEEGHSTLMELIDRGLLKILHEDIIVVEGAALNMINCCPQGFGGTDSLGLASVSENDKGKGLGRIIRTDGMIKTLCNPKTRVKISTLLIDGSRLCREITETFFYPLQGLQVLAVFGPRFKSLISSLFKMDKLLVLVLRSCDLLEDITCIKKLKTLTVLEISGAVSLESMPEKLFDEMTQLQSLNLSGLKTRSLPSLSNLSELRLLILRGCSRLTTLPSLKRLINLEKLDLSGATSFDKFEDLKTLSALQKLQMIDLSDTRIKTLPKFQHLKHLTKILLRGCCDLCRLPSLTQLPSLQILDLSGAIKFNEFHNDSIENLDDLKVLNLSKTLISQLPSIFCNISELNLSGCSKLEKLPCTTALKNLELLDVSNALDLAETEDISFQHLKYLHYLNFSNTKVKNLPSLSKLSNLRQLLLKNCLLLENLPEMDGLTRLEVLDISGCACLIRFPALNVYQKLKILNVSGCRALEVEENESLERMSRVRELNLDQCGANSLSKVAVESLEYMTNLRILKLSGISDEYPSISKVTTLTNLTHLSLKDYSGLTVPSFEALPKLEVLEFSATAVGSLPFLENLSNLRELSLSGCSSLEVMPSLKSHIRLEVLDISKTGIKEFPYGISELNCLKRLVLPDFKVVAEADWGRIKRLPEDIKWGHCNIESNFQANGRNPSIKVNVNKFSQLLKANPELLKSCVNEISFSVCPPHEQAKDGENYVHGDEVMLSDVFSLIRHFPCYKIDAQSIDIRGFDSLSIGVKDVLKDILKQTEYISLSENMFMSHLSDLDEGSFAEMKGCWLERCPQIESIFGEETDGKLGEQLEILWVSNLSSLKSLYSVKVQSVNFKNLTHLHVEYCPKLEYVFTSSQFPENLIILKIKFCRSLKTLFEHKESAKFRLLKLQTLLLFELPELTSIGVMLPRLNKVKIRKCQKLDNSEVSNLQK